MLCPGRWLSGHRRGDGIMIPAESAPLAAATCHSGPAHRRVVCSVTVTVTPVAGPRHGPALTRSDSPARDSATDQVRLEFCQCSFGSGQCGSGRRAARGRRRARAVAAAAVTGPGHWHCLWPRPADGPVTTLARPSQCGLSG